MKPFRSDRASVLLVCGRADSDPAVVQVMSVMGESIVRARSPQEAMALVREQDFALILVGFPGELDLLTNVIREVRGNRRSSHTPVVALALPENAPFSFEPLYEAGAVAVLTEPLSPVILRAKARFYIEAFEAMVQRGRAESALRDTRSRLEAIIDAAELGVWNWDVAADRVSGDARTAEMFGVAPDLQDGAPLAAYFAAFHPDDVAPTRTLLEQAVARGDLYDATFRVRLAGGGWRWVIGRGQVERGDDGEVRRLRGVVIDATRQFEAEQQLRLSEERYRTLFESIDEGVCVIEMLYDADGQPCDYRFLETNPAFVKQTGLVDAVGRTVREFAPNHEHHWFELYGRVAATGEPVRFDNEARALGRWYDVYAARIGPAALRRVAVVFNDITERRNGENALRRMADDLAEANRVKTEFLATLAHELRNPLAPIRSGLQFIRRASSDAAAVARVQDIMERQLGHLVNLVDDLLDVARITRGQIELRRERIDLATVLDAAVETSMPLIEAARHHLDVEQPIEPLIVDADLTRMTQVVSNLLNNAARYTPRGGSIVLAAQRDGEQAVIAVSDNGIGIAPAALDEVFKMFTQVGEHRQQAAGGLGIGLSLVRSLVELHGGSVTASSAGTNAGSVFTVRLPLAADATVPVALDAPEAAAPHAGLRILVVDDNRDAAETLAALLGHAGHSAPVANDGHQALRMMASFQPQVVFLDLGMPGMSGYEVASAIRQEPRNAGVRLVALTGWGGDAERARTATAGFDDHLTKPATLEAIEAVLAGLQPR